MNRTVIGNISAYSLLEAALSAYLSMRDEEESKNFLADFIARSSFASDGDLITFYDRLFARADVLLAS